MEHYSAVILKIVKVSVTHIKKQKQQKKKKKKKKKNNPVVCKVTLKST